MGYFEILAECSVALGGFAAIHSALQGSTGGRGAMRAWSVVTLGIGAFMLSLVALLAERLPGEPAMRWRIASAIGATLGTLTLASIVYLDRRFTAIGQPRQFGFWLMASWTAQITGIVGMAANIVGWPMAPNANTLAVSLTFFLSAAVIGLVGSFWLNVEAELTDRAND